MTAGTTRPALLAPRPAAPVVACLAVTASLLVAAPASAHTRLDRAAPAPDAVVDPGVAEVVLDFTGQVRPELSTVVVTGPEGSGTAGAPVTRGTDVVQPLAPPLASGSWTVTYRVVAEDGHPVSGTFAFTVTPTPPSAEPQDSSGAEVATPAPSPSPSAAVPEPTATPAALGPSELAAASADGDDPDVAAGPPGLSAPALAGVLLAGVLAGGVLLLRTRGRRRA